MTAEDRATFVSARAGLHAQLDRALASLSLLYAMRLDIREAIYGDNDPAPPPLDPQLGRLLYDLPQLDEKNVSVRYLEKTEPCCVLPVRPSSPSGAGQQDHAIDGLVDRARFRANSRYLEGVLARGGAHVLDLESGFTAGEFVDEAHLNAQGQRRLASILANALRETVGEVTRPENRIGYGRRNSARIQPAVSESPAAKSTRGRQPNSRPISAMSRIETGTSAARPSL